ncbi:MAG: hypothetical protein MJ231_08260 [bacterium]|nr:hypothetical protein [bacterium]
MRCTKTYNGIQGQCEFFRGTFAHGGMISIHYINRNYSDFFKTQDLWYEVIKTAKLYNSYYRDERTFDKSEYVEL